MERNVRTYEHFCMLARALEQVGDRWSLLIVRDLLGGPRRFTDLSELLGGITPKTLSQRLRELEEAGVVEVDREKGRREVWYALTPAGEELAPAVNALFLWGLRHARRPPAPGEAVHAEHLLKAVRVVLQHTPSPRSPVTWHFILTDGGRYSLAFDGEAWALGRRLGDAMPDVTVTAATSDLTRYLTTPTPDRSLVASGLDVEGGSRAVQQLTRYLDRFPDGAF